MPLPPRPFMTQVLKLDEDKNGVFHSIITCHNAIIAVPDNA